MMDKEKVGQEGEGGKGMRKERGGMAVEEENGNRRKEK